MKAKSTTVIMVKAPVNYSGITYAPIDKPAEDVLGGRNSFEVQIPVRGRSLPMNSLWAVWYGLIGKESGQSVVEVKCECKLLYGVPILCAEDEAFRRVWNAKFSGDTYEQQIFMMRYLPVTSLLSKSQGMIYTETLQREYAKQQIVLDVL
jgi:hypothetical protein